MRYLTPTDFQNAVKIIKNITLNAKQKSLTEFLTFLKNITRKSISKLDRVTNFRLLRSTETSLLIGWNLPMSLENNRHAFHNLSIRVSWTDRGRTVDESLYRIERDFFDENTCFYILELVKYQSFYQVKFSLEFQFQ